MLADGEAHVVGILDRCKIEMPAPDKGAQHVQKARPSLNVARTGARFDKGRPLPRTPDAFVIALRRLHRQHHGRDRGVGTQTQVSAEHIAIGSDIAQRGAHLAGGAHEGHAGIVIIRTVKSGLIKEANQINVRGIIQLARAHLAHRQHGHPGAVPRVLRPHPRQFAAAQLRVHSGPQSCVTRRIRQPG